MEGPAAGRRPDAQWMTGTSLRSARRPRRSPDLPRALLAALVAVAHGACAPVLAPNTTGRGYAAAPAPPRPHAFTVPTLNPYLLPTAVFSTDQRLRGQLLVEHLSGYDAIVLELFDEGASAILLTGLEKECLTKPTSSEQAADCCARMAG